MLRVVEATLDEPYAQAHFMGRNRQYHRGFIVTQPNYIYLCPDIKFTMQSEKIIRPSYSYMGFSRYEWHANRQMPGHFGYNVNVEQ